MKHAKIDREGKPIEAEKKAKVGPACVHGKLGRHAPAFILLILSNGPNHGLGILNYMDKIMIGHRLDTAVIYRVLKKLHSEGFITSHWEDSEAGPKKKVYCITENGREELVCYKDEIEGIIEKLSVFLDLYNKL